MTLWRRLLLVILVFVIPLATAQILYELSIMVLEYFEYIVNPVLLRYTAIGEYTLIFTLCLLEAEARW